MSIHFSQEMGIFSLETQHSSYRIKIGSYGYLLHLYYGAKVALEDDLSLLAYPLERSFSGNPNESGSDITFTIDTLPQEYSMFGSGDYRSPCLISVNPDGTREADLRYVSHTIEAGAVAPEGLPHVYDNGGEAETLKIHLEDSVTHLRVTLVYTVFENQDAITRYAVIENGTSGQVQLEKALSACLDFTHGDYDIITFWGRHCFERAVERTSVRHGKIIVDSLRGASSHQQNPFMILCNHDATETAGDCWGMSLLYSGNFIAECEYDQIWQTRLTMGIHPHAFRWILEKGESFTTPQVAMVYSESGLGELSRRYHRLYRHNLCRGEYKTSRRPVLINNWEATYFDFDDDKLVQIAEDASKLGIELLVMDDGWFGKREDDTTGLGDWVVNTKKIRGGLDSLCRRVNALGMKLGIWFEPEMISEDSDLYRAHPEWCLRGPGRAGVRSRHQFVLDMSRQDVRDYLFDAISSVLKQANLEYVKWDMNRHITNIYSGALPADRQGEVYHRYILGVYDLMERLTSAFPHVLFEGCSGGGGRFDAGMLYYTPQIWCSDDTDAIERLSIQYGTSFGYPVSSVGSHVSAVPNHQTGHITPLETRGIVAMSGTFGYELDINKMTPEEKDMVRLQVEEYKRLYPLLADGDYYRLSNPFENTNYTAWQFASPDQSRALLNVVQVKMEVCPVPFVIRLRGLDAKARYRVQASPMNHPTRFDYHGETYSGAALMNAGLLIPVLQGDYSAVQYLLEKI